LLAEGADINAVDKEGNSVVHLALSQGQSKAAALLKQKGGKDLGSVKTASNAKSDATKQKK